MLLNLFERLSPWNFPEIVIQYLTFKTNHCAKGNRIILLKCSRVAYLVF